MAIKVLVIPTAGTPYIEYVPRDNYETLSRLVGGYLEAIPFPNAMSYVNEDGKEQALPVNELATSLCFECGVGLAPDDYISGTMVLFGPPDAEGLETDVPRYLCDKLGLFG